MKLVKLALQSLLFGLALQANAQIQNVPPPNPGNTGEIQQAFMELQVLNAITPFPGELGSLVTAFTNFPNALSETNALARLVPANDGGLLRQSFQVQQLIFDSINQRIHFPKFYAGGKPYGDPLAFSTGWVTFIGQQAQQNNREDLPGYKDTIGGVVIGADMHFNDNSTVGAALSWARLNIKSNFVEIQSESDNYQAALYGHYQCNNPWRMDWLASVGFNDYHTHRDILFNTEELGIDDNFKGWQFGAFSELGYDNRIERFHIVPILSLFYAHLFLERYNQSGAETADQMVNSSHYNLFRGATGVRFHYDGQWRKGVFQPELHLRGFYDFVEERFQVDSQFIGTDVFFTTVGARVPRASYNVGGSLAYWQPTPSMDAITLRISYDCEFKNGYKANSGFVRLRYEW